MIIMINNQLLKKYQNKSRLDIAQQIKIAPSYSIINKGYQSLRKFNLVRKM